MSDKSGVLYLCATPIGNLEDMTYRAVRILGEVPVIAAEDTRHTRNLLNHFAIRTPLISYHEHNKAQRGPELINRLLAGEDIAVVSDAGLPGISDPGSDLVKLAVEAGITVSPLPGPNAALAGVVCSGLDTRMFLFAGFLPKTTKKRRELLRELAAVPYTLVIYETPHRLIDTLGELVAACGDRPAVAGRELTKKFEEFCRGTLDSLKGHFECTAPRGEFTLIVAGNKESGLPQAPAELPDPIQAVSALVATGVAKKEAIRMVATQQGRSRREVYQAVLGQEKG
ncbi:MAG: 16S rRNA (cytidine(1402)-2'-O)-methyltransferase [Negativicutes bacterium]|nr:16S rRNA (cytidine(1402)-2'-O)-methyltransferase [Negativicutes bacterium]